MTSLLLLKNVNAKTHQGIRTKFSEHYIKTGIMPVAVAEYVRTASNLREEADYDLDVYDCQITSIYCLMMRRI